METVTKVVHAASTAIWGEGNDNQSTQPHGEEPISGVQGKGAANDPYDAGNRDEQPSAPTTEIDPLAQEPKLDYKPQTLDAKTDATGTAVPDINSTTAVTLPKPTETPNNNVQTQSVATEQRGTESLEKSGLTENATAAAAGGSGSGSGNSNAPESAKQVASKEALEGPQGPAPHPASEFEDEAKGKMPATKKTKPVESESPASSSSAKSDTSAKSPSKASNGSGNGNGNGNGKHSTMAKVKEGLKKVAHPRHGSKTSSSS